MQRAFSIIKPVIANVVCTGELSQYIDFQKFWKYSWAIYDEAIYGGKCGYVKFPGMKGKVTIFSNGKLISVGANSINKSKNQLFQTKYLLKESKLISDVELKPKIVNIVATLNLGRNLNLSRITKKLPGSKFNPNEFPGIIWKNTEMPSCLIFRNGKILLVGSKSLKKLAEISLIIQKILN